MLTLLRLDLEGFGPFAERQTLQFPIAPGVTVIYGENMRGKTTLLNAIRYAFFGKVLGRGARSRRLHSISNRERAADGVYGFNVSLSFLYDGAEYELSRSCEPRTGTPVGDSDYSQTVFLRRGDSILGPQERDQALELIFPAEISRFFLFDGELLQEYEELLINESEAGHRISEAIERILGVPILKRARAHLVLLSEEADKSAAREALKHKDTEGVGTALQLATEQRAAHQGEIQRLQEDLADLNTRRGELEQFLQMNEKYRALLQEQHGAKARLSDVRTESQRYRTELQRAMADAWRTVVRDKVRLARGRANEVASGQIGLLELHFRQVAVESEHCQICDQDLSEQVRQQLRLTWSGDEGTMSLDEIARTLSQASRLEEFRDGDNASEVRGIWKAIRARDLERVTLEERLGDLSAALSDSDQTTLRESTASYGEVIEKIGVVRRGIEEHTKKVSELDQNIQRLRRGLAEATGARWRTVQREAEMLRQASDVITRTVEEYKADLRGRVEASASELFLTMTTEVHDYARLSINAAYGLTIVHRDGRAEEARSAGAEHVVALALMGALQRNAPLQGPIVMDSPFGRLDAEHTSNIVRALPQMASQVVLLVYEAEVGRSLMREVLGSALLREYELERVSSRRTIIREVR